MNYAMLFGNCKYAFAISCKCKEINIDIESFKLYIDEWFPLRQNVKKENNSVCNHANNKNNAEVVLRPMIVK